jgi:kynurenine formamidase
MFDGNQLIDLSNPLANDCPVWPTLSQFDVTQTAWAARDGATMESIEMTSHAGTHLDAPLHFIPEGKTVDDYPISKFVGEGVVLDLAPLDREQQIGRDMLEAFDDAIRPQEVVMLHTGWDQYHGRTPEYLFEFPHLTGDAAQYLASKDLKAVGIDTLSVGGWGSEVAAHGPATDVDVDESHLPLLENDILPVEELRNLGRVLDGSNTRRAEFGYFPINYQGTSGASVRAFAVV